DVARRGGPGAMLAERGPGGPRSEKAVGGAPPVARSRQGSAPGREEVAGEPLFRQPVEVVDGDGDCMAERAGNVRGGAVFLVETITVEGALERPLGDVSEGEFARPAVITEITAAGAP